MSSPTPFYDFLLQSTWLLIGVGGNRTWRIARDEAIPFWKAFANRANSFFLTFLFWGCIIWGQINKSFAATLTTTYFICHEFSSISFSFVRLLFLCLYLQDDHKAFRRQLEDKRPIVESNLTSGRQYIASEAPVSDTSDTEGKFNEIPLNYYVRVHSGLTDSKRWPQKTPWICKHYFKLTFTMDTISDGLHYS